MNPRCSDVGRQGKHIQVRRQTGSRQCFVRRACGVAGKIFQDQLRKFPCARLAKLRDLNSSLPESVEDRAGHQTELTSQNKFFLPAGGAAKGSSKSDKERVLKGNARNTVR